MLSTADKAKQKRSTKSHEVSLSDFALFRVVSWIVSSHWAEEERQDENAKAYSTEYVKWRVSRDTDDRDNCGRAIATQRASRHSI